MSFKGDGERVRYVSGGSAPSRQKVGVKNGDSRMGAKEWDGSGHTGPYGYSKTRALPFTQGNGGDL